jgi:hypothetical protein
MSSRSCAEDAGVIARFPDFDHYVLQIVRDPRAVTYSWRRNKILDHRTGVMMGRKRPLNSVLRWVENCLCAEVLRTKTDPSRWLFMRYEDFAAEPQAAIARIIAFVGESAGVLPFEGERTVCLTVNHTVSGNSDRFLRGPVTIRTDTAWKEALSKRDRLLATLLSLPLLPRYGYSVWPD